MPLPLPLLSVSVVPDRDHVRVIAAGEIDLATAHLLGDALAELFDSGWTDVTADLREVGFMDTSGMHVLLDAADRAGRLGAAFKVVVDPGPVKRLVELTGSDDILSAGEPAASALG